MWRSVVQVFVLRLWFVILAVGMLLLVIAPITFVAQVVFNEVQERVNRTASAPAMSRTSSVAIPYSIDEEPVALPDNRLLHRTLVSGMHHSCAVTRAAYVVCWGDNTAGQLGVGITADIALAQTSISPVVGVTRAVSVALGVAHSCVLQESGQVWCWGDNTYRQLGSERGGPLTSRSIAAPVVKLPAAQQIVSGANHVCMLSQTREVWCWGDNQYAQISQNQSTSGVVPTQITMLPSDVIALNAGSNHTCALTASGEVWCWGRNQQQQIDSSTDEVVREPRRIFGDRAVTQVGLARDSACVVFVDMQFACQGATATLNGISAILSPSAQLVSSALGQHCVLADSVAQTCWDEVSPPTSQNIPGVTLVSSGDDFACLLLRAGLVQCRGDNQRRQIAPSLTATQIPEYVFVPLGSSNNPMSAGYAHVCTIWQLGKVQCWGRNLEGQIAMPVQDSLLFTASPHEVDINGIVRLAVAGNHTCAIRYDRRVVCWGANNHGQLGLGDARMRDTPTVVTSLTDVTQVAVGTNHSCVLQRSGQVWCWGDNRFGQSAGSTTQQTTPMRVSALSNVMKIAAGGNTTCALQSDGYLICWGAEIGDVPSFTPIRAVSDVADMAIGYAHACAVQITGTVYCWGDHHYSQNGISMSAQPVQIVGVPLIRSVAVGVDHSCLLDIQQNVWCWGKNSQGQVNGEPSNSIYATPELQYRGTSHVVTGNDFTCVRQQIGATVCWGGNRYAQLGIDDASVHFFVNTAVNDGFVVAAGGNHSCVLLTNSTTRCWGGNEYGQLGDGTTNSSSTPQTVRGNESFVDIDAGLAHTCVIVNDATVRCWGHNNFGQLGDVTTDNANSPVIAAVQDVRKLALGNSHSCALLGDGGGACWGRNEEGQLGVGGTANSAMPLRVANLDAALDISSGADHVCVVRQDGTVWCWGSNRYGQLGFGEVGPGVSIPTQVPGILNAVAVGLGDNHSCALTVDRTVWCWGWNNYGQSGDALVDDKSIVQRPQQVTGVSDVVQLHVGGNHTCVLTQDANAFCWGDNFNGQLGDPTVTTPYKSTPNVVSGITRFVSLAAGGAHTCGLLQDGDTLCWGWNRFGQIGNGSSGITRDVPEPAPVIALYDASIVAIAGSHMCARHGDGDVSCWGENATGQLGNGVFGDTLALAEPQTVSLLAPGVTVTTGANHSCALISSTEVVCWGSNEFGQIGNGFAGAIANTASPNFVSGLIGVSQMASGGNSNCAVVSGDVYCWGDNQYAQVGQPTVGIGDVRTIPTKVELLSAIQSVVMGKHHACALASSGLVYCWGRNNQAQLGGYVGDSASTPSVVQNISDVVQISAGDDHTCAVTTQGALYCWGSNNAGQLGVESTDQPVAFYRVDIGTIRQVAAGGSHTCAYDGTSVVCWGGNEHGQLGLDVLGAQQTAANNRTPVANLLSVSSIFAGGNRSCAITQGNREVWCWGQNENAQLGVTNNPDMNAPVAVIDLWSMQVNELAELQTTPMPTPRMPQPTASPFPTQAPLPTATLIRPNVP